MPNSHILIFCCVYVSGCLITAFLMEYGTLDLNFFISTLPGRTEWAFGVFQSFVFCATLLLGRTLIKNRGITSAINTYSFNFNLSKYRPMAWSMLIAYCLMITVLYWREMTSYYIIRHSGNQFLGFITLLWMSIGVLTFHKDKYFFRLIASIILLYTSTVASSLGASRAVAIPFFALALSYFYRKNFLTGSVIIYLSIVALFTAFEVRGYPSYERYWVSFFTNALSFELTNFLIVCFNYSFPGLITVQAAMLLPGEVSISSVGRFITYISPIPSQLLPENLFSGLSLSELLGFDRSKLGINYDLYSEGIYWFGVGGAWIYTVFTGLLIMLPYWVANYILKRPIPVVYMLCFFVNLWIVVGCQVMVLRAGSRASLGLTLIFIFIAIFQKIRIKA